MPNVGSKVPEIARDAMSGLSVKKILGRYQSGQMGQTVNLLAYAFGGSNPSLPTPNRSGLSDAVCFCGSSSVDRASAFQAEGREFEPRLPLLIRTQVRSPMTVVEKTIVVGVHNKSKLRTKLLII